MITIELNEHSAEDVKAIMELQKFGFSDEEIQKIYDRAHGNEKERKGEK